VTAALVHHQPARAAGAAADADAADAAIRRGVELRRQNNDQDALEEFRKAYALVKSPRALAQIGLAEQALGRWTDAESDLDEAMASRSDPWIRKNAATLKGALDTIRRHLGSLDVIGPAGAELLVDGRNAGTLPLKKPVRAPIGSLTLEVRKDGFFPATRPVSIVAGQLTRESVDLQPQPVAAPPPPPPIRAAAPEARPTGIPEAAAGAPPVQPAAERSTGGGVQRTLAWTTAIGALVGAGAGVAALLIHSAKVTDANDVPCNIVGRTVNPKDPAQQGHCLDLAAAADQARVAAVISFSAAGALAIASVLLFVTQPSSSSASAAGAEHASTTGFVCAPTLATTGVACQLRF
jgi:hypothetical protein